MIDMAPVKKYSEGR